MNMDEFRAKLRNTVPGQMSLGGEGPPRKTCRECLDWRSKGWYAASNAKHGPTLKPGPCAGYKRHTGRMGADVPHGSAACKYFRPNPDAPPRVDPNSLLL